MEFSFAQPTILGRTVSQIRSAKAKAKPGGKKKCKKGKSCGSACIAGSKVCMVGLPEFMVTDLEQFRDRLMKKKRARVKTPAAPPAKATPKPPKVQFSHRLETSQDFQEEMKRTEGFYSPQITVAHGDLALLLSHNSRNAKEYAELKDEITKDPKRKQLFETRIQKIKDRIGEKGIADGFYAIRSFTSSGYSQIRGAEKKGLDKIPPKSGEKEDKNDPAWGARKLQQFLNQPELHRAEVTKFRGMTVDDQMLKDFIETAKIGGGYLNNTTSSWSTQLITATNFSENGIGIWGRNRVIFRTINRRGVGVDFNSSIPDEKEMLTPKGAKYIHAGYREITYGGKTYHVFDMVEL